MSRPRRGWRAAAGTALVMVAVLAALGSMTGLLAPGPWVPHTAFAVTGTALVLIVVRALSRSAWLPTVVAAAVVGYVLVVVHGSPPTGIRPVPDGRTLDRLRALVDEGVRVIDEGVVPLDAPPSVVALVVVGAVAALLAADLLALTCGLPALSGIALVALWTPSVVLGFRGSWWAVAGTAAAYLLLLALDHAGARAGARAARRSAGRGGRDRPPRTLTVGGARSAAAVLATTAALVAVTLVVAPTLTAAGWWRWAPLRAGDLGGVGTVRLAEDLDLRDSLTRQSQRVVLRYTVTGTGDQPADVDAALVGPLRSFTLRDFDGTGWTRQDAQQLTDWDADLLLTPDPDRSGTTPDAARGTLARVMVQVGDLRDPRVPITVHPRTLRITGDWQYDPLRDEVTGGLTAPGDTYRMVVEVPELDADLLRAADGPALEDADAYLTVPGTAHQNDLRALAEQVVGDATSVYDRAVALQAYFRDSTRFRYDTTVDIADGEDVVWDFIQNGRGYCVQYATAMTVLARMLGIPARLAVGFLPGSRTNDGGYASTGADAHAWPELYFPGSGWVRFEPTPAVQTGRAPSWTVDRTGTTATDDPAATAAPTQTAGATPTATTSATGTGTAADAGSPARWWPFAAAALLMIAAAAAIAVLARRRAHEVTDAERAWQLLRHRLRRAHVTWSDARTPRQAAALVRSQVDQARGRPLGTAADHALDLLVHAVEQDRYAPLPDRTDPHDLRRWVDTVVADVSGSRAAAPRAAASDRR